MSDINVTVQDEIVNIDVLDTPVIVEVTNSPGQQGPAGVGVPVGGTTGQVLAKTSATDYATAWVNPSGGGVPYSGATGNVNIGEYELKAGQLTLDLTPTGTAAVGTTRWNDTIGATETTLKGGSVVLKNGVDLVARVVNKVTPNTTLTKAAYQAVRISGAQGQRLAVALAQANNDTNSADTIGLVTETIPTNQEGFIMTMGQLENINTTGSLQGETWVDGDVLYLSPTTAGALTNIKPTGAGHIVVIGYVEYAHVNNGKIYTKVMNGWELDELHDVDIISPANNEALIYESSTSLWKNKTIATALGYTPANAATTLTINGVTYDLSANRSWTVAAGISGSGAAGQVTYWTGASAVSGSNNLFWDAANGRLGIGTNAPADTLHLNSGGIRIQNIRASLDNFYTAGVVNGLKIQNTTTNGRTLLGLVPNGTSNLADFWVFNTSDTTTNYSALAWGFESTSNFWGINAISAGTGVTRPIYINATNAQNVGTANISFYTNGNVGIGTGSTAPSVRFGVIGDTLLRGSGNTNTTTALTVQNSGSTNLFVVRNDGISKFGSSSYFDVSSPLIVGTDGALGARITIANNGTYQDSILVNTSITSGNINTWSFGQRRDTAFGNTLGSFQIVGGYVDNTGTFSTVGGGYRVPLICNPNGDVLINGGNANVVNGLIGLKVNAPTAHVDITASTTANASLRIRSGVAPTSPNDGDIWFDGTNIQMRIGGVTKTFTLI